jgi:predicted enzyme related to lactoylglutathione lyase
MSGRVVHFEMPYEDGARARAFYGELFGWDLQEMPEMSYTMVSSGPTGDQGPTEPGFINGGMGQRADGFSGPRVVIDVEDIDSTLAQIEGKGGTVVTPKYPVGPMGWTAYFTDPEGNVVGLWQSARQEDAP